MKKTRPAVVAEASDPVQAAIWVDALRAAGIKAGSFERSEAAALGGATIPGWAAYPVVVDGAEIGRARNVIADLAGGSVLAPIVDPDAAWVRSRQLLTLAGVALAAVIVIAVLASIRGS